MNGNVRSALKGVKDDVVSMAKFAWKRVESIPTKLLLFGLVINIGFVQSSAASASTTSVVGAAVDDGTVTIADMIGCANLNWAADLVPLARETTGILLGLGYLLIAILSAIIGIKLLTAGRNQDRVVGVQQEAVSWGKGAVVLIFGVPAVALVLGGLTVGCEFLTARI